MLNYECSLPGLILNIAVAANMHQTHLLSFFNMVVFALIWPSNKHDLQLPSAMPEK